MGFFSDSDKRSRRDSASGEKASDKVLVPAIELPSFEPGVASEGLRGSGSLSTGDTSGPPLIFNKFSTDKIRELMAWSGIFSAIEAKGYTDYELDLEYLSEMDQRIYIRAAGVVLIHIRLKLSDFGLRLHPGNPRCRLLYIDWLLTQHPRSARVREERLFPGQELPGLGIFTQISDFITNLALGVGADGAFNIPEYFHDAMLFHRQFFHYDPHREAFLRAIIRDLRQYGARQISRAFSDGRIVDHSGSPVNWTPAEMISVIKPELEEQLWSRDYYTRVVREIKRMRFAMLPVKEEQS
ncbi:MAG: hypothetical protein KDK39_02225 [Leptospiraceae bacterium]|nr:hypothetical protein [Leptospiraceae bacterium]